MTQDNDSKDDLSELRRRAERVATRKPLDMSEVPLLSAEELRHVIHELQVHQVELEMQNEELRRTQLALEEARDKYRELYDYAPVGYFTLGHNGVILGANLNGSRLFGLERDLLIGKQFASFTDEEGGKTLYLHFREAVETRCEQTCEVQIPKRDGSQVFLRLQSLPSWSKDGSIKGFRTAAFDITERKRTEELALQTARLRSVADVSSGVAHHFNNLLQIVMGGASLALDDLESGELSEVKKSLEMVLMAVTRGAEIVGRLQTFANTGAGTTEREFASFDATATVRNAAEVSKPLWMAEAERAGVKIDLRMALEDGCRMTGQENEIFEVILNLLRNAAEALPQGGVIEVQTLKDADNVVILVRDTGTGMAGEDLSHIFQPFWTTKGFDIGKGMGLAAAHGLVKRHGGTISVRSKVGEGTTFTVRFPLAREPVRKRETPEVRIEEVSLTILVIDDEVQITRLIERICAEMGHTVFKALSGEEALAIFNKESVDLVISDLGMAGMSGWEVGKTIRSICEKEGIAKPPFILLTGWGGQELERAKIAESGTDLVVTKPINTRALRATIKEIAGRFNIQSRVT